MVGVEIDDGQGQRVVLHHARLDFVSERKSDRGRLILAAYFLVAGRGVNDPLKIDEGFTRLVQVS